MNIKQVNWAKQHDWFLSSYLDSNGLYIVRAYQSEDDSTVKFDNVKLLANWAGY